MKTLAASRRSMLLSALAGTGYVGLRALATGLPVSFVMNPRKALADMPPAPPASGASKAQFIILQTSGNGDPINASVPGTYEDSNIAHSQDPTMAPTSLTLAGTKTTAAAPWAKLPQSVLDRTQFWHLMTDTPIHPKEPEVLKLMGASYQNEMLPSLLAKQLAPQLGTIQAQPISLGAASPSEGLVFGGQALPIIPALALKATLTTPGGALAADLQKLRDGTLAQMYDLYKTSATPAQKAYIDSMVKSQQEVRNIDQNLLNQLSSITDNSPASQILAAITLIQMKVTPVIAIHIPFGGDNHRDPSLANETQQTNDGVATIAALMQQLAAAKLQDQVSFVSLNVFGRTLAKSSNPAKDNSNGRQHNPNHQASIVIGAPFKGGIVGGIAPVQGDYGALPIDSKTGKGTTGGDIPADGTLASFGRTLLAAVGADDTTIAQQVTTGTVIRSVLA